MSTEEPTTTGATAPAWGAPTPAAARHPWSTRKIVVAAVIAVVIVGGGSAAVIAASGSGSSTATGGLPGGGGGGFGGGGFGGAGGMRGGAGGFGGTSALSDALHGDFVVSAGNGKYTTERLQTGKATKVAAGSITVASTDGYTQTYTVTSSTSVDRGQNKIGDIKTGEGITVVATLSGQTATAATIEEETSGSTGAVGQSGPPAGGSGTGGTGGTGSGGFGGGRPGGGMNGAPNGGTNGGGTGN